jgi:ribosomal protein S27AE
MEHLLKNLRRDYPHLRFSEGTAFCWSPISGEIFYSTSRKTSASAKFSILHELAHALLTHTHYSSDYELLNLEIAAWEYAKEIAKRYDIGIDDEYIQNCLDSYRDWLYKRSICPRCGNKSIQCDDSSYYQCFNCHSRWRVAESKFCRPYRHHKGNQKSPTTIVAGDSLDQA